VLTFVVKVVLGECVEVAVTSLFDYNPIIRMFAATASGGKFASRLAPKFNTDLLVHGTFAIGIVLSPTTFQLRFVAEICPVVFEAYAACFLQIVAPALTVRFLSFVFIAAFLGLKGTGATAI
jgi:hypothetical protein